MVALSGLAVDDKYVIWTLARCRVSCLKFFLCRTTARPQQPGGPTLDRSSKESTMNTHSIITQALASVVALAGAGAAFAQEATPDRVQTGQSVTSRADVHAQAVAATAAGRIGYGEASRSFDDSPKTMPKLTRTQVAAEAQEARRLGLMQVGEGVARDVTASERAAIRAAGQRAIELRSAAAR
jgi:hypothetical protein